MQKYKLKISIIAENDLKEITEYITNVLENKIAADNFLNEFEKSVKARLSSPTSFQKYQSNKNRKTTYYTLLVKNYTVFYIVKNDVMKITRVIYSKRNFTELI